MSMIAGSVVEMWSREYGDGSREVEEGKLTIDFLRPELQGDPNRKRRSTLSAREKYDSIAAPLFDALLTIYENLAQWFWPRQLPSWAKFSLSRDGGAEGICGSALDDAGTPCISINANRFVAASKFDGAILQQIMVVLIRAVFHAVKLKSGTVNSEDEWNARELPRFGIVGNPFDWNVYEDSPAYLAYQIFLKKKIAKSLRFDRLLKAYRACSDKDRVEIDEMSDLLLSLDAAFAHGVNIASIEGFVATDERHGEMNTVKRTEAAGKAL